MLRLLVSGWFMMSSYGLDDDQYVYLLEQQKLSYNNENFMVNVRNNRALKNVDYTVPHYFNFTADCEVVPDFFRSAGSSVKMYLCETQNVIPKK